MTRLFLAALLLMRVSAQEVQYTIEFPNAVHHEAEIEVRFERAPPLLEVRMSRSSPGRYATHEFARNVSNVRATDGAGRTLSFTRPNAHQWNVSGHDGTVVLRYTLFGDSANGTYASIDSSRAVLNTPASLLWARQLQSLPAIVRVKPPAGSNWKVATQLQPLSELSFRAPHLQYLLDSPLLIGKIVSREWNAGEAKMRLAMAHRGTDAEATAFARTVEASVIEAEGVFGELPAFDFGAYTFLVDINRGLGADGMEHRNSTVVNMRQSIKEMRSAAGVIPHEFFHAWNVERIRPKSLEPFQFEDANISEELWFAEGFTSYYAFLISRRAGLISLDRMCVTAAASLNAALLSPGREENNVVAMSQYAPFADRGGGGGTVTYAPDNLRNTFISYYSYGAAVALGIDLSIRSEFPSKSLDDWMRAMWVEFGRAQRDYAPVKTYTLSDLERTLASVTTPAFASRIFNQHIRGKQPMPYEALLAKAGLLLRPAKPAAAWLGHTAFTFSDAGAVVAAGTLRGTPLYQAGLDNRDRIVLIDGKALKSQRDLDEWLKSKKPGEKVTAKVETGTGSRDIDIVLSSDPTLEIVRFEQAKLDVSKEQSAFRDLWLTSKAKRPLPQLHRYCPQCRRAHPFEFENCPYDGKPLELVLP